MSYLRAARKKRTWRYLVTQNPFYLISVCLVLYGLQLSFASGQTLTAGLMLFGILSGYTALLALTGYVIIRFGQVWDDARMLLLLIVLLLVALSLSFDELVIANQVYGASLLTAGFVFAMVVSEGVLRSLKIRLAMWYRVPYYVLLALLFFYPLGLAHLSFIDRDETMAWCVFLFPAAAAVGFLLLVPAVHLGSSDPRPSGTPWPFPLYPWSLFVVMGVTVALRSYSLSMSYEGMIGSGNTFRGYFLVPLLLAGLVLFTEYALIHRRAWLPLVALVLPMAVFPLGLPGSPNSTVEMGFRRMLIHTLGSPVQWVLGLMIVFFLYAWIRRVRKADVALCACVVMAAFVDLTTVDLNSLVECRPEFIAGAAAVMFVAAGLRGGSPRALAGCGLSVWSVSLHFSGPWWGVPEEYLVLNVMLLCSLLVLLLADDPIAREFRREHCFAFPVLSLAVLMLYPPLFPRVPEWLHLHVVGCLALFSLVCWYRIAHPRQLVSAMTTMGVYLSGGVRMLPNLTSHSQLDRGGRWIVGGLVVLVVGLLFSLAKGGHRLHLRRRILRLNAGLRSGTRIE